MGLGLAALGRPGYINLGHAADLEHDYDPAVMEARTHAVLDAAWAAGVRYIDVARSYGRAEAFLSTWLARRRITPEHITVGSKWGYTYTAGWRVTAAAHEIKEHSVAVLTRQFGESRRFLGAYLDLYHIHSATLDSGVLDNDDVLRALGRIRTEGVRVGLTLSGPLQTATLHAALTIRIDGQRLFDCVQATWNLLEPSAGAAFEQAHAAGMGVIIKEALANGRLTARDAIMHARLAGVATRLGTTVDALALAAALAQPWADVVLSGAASIEHLQSNLTALNVPWNDDIAAELRSLIEPPEEYWATRAKLPWN